MSSEKKPGQIAQIRRMFKMLTLTKVEIALLVLLATGAALFEGIGVGMLAPVLQYIQFGPSAAQSGSGIWKVLYAFADAIHMPITLGTLLILAFIPVMLRQVVYFFYTWYSAVVQQRAATRLRAEGFGAIVHSDLSFTVGEGHGNLVSALTMQVWRGGQAIFNFVQILSIVVLVVAYMIILFMLSWQMTLISVASLGLISILSNKNVTRSRKLGHEASELNNVAYSTVGERLGAIRLIKMLGQEDSETSLVTKVVRTLEEVQVRIAIARAWIEVTIDPLQMLSVFVVIWVGVEIFGVSLASLGLFMFVLTRLNQKVKDFNMGRQTMSAYIDSLQYVKDVTRRAEDARSITSGGKTFDGLRDVLAFENVSFSYGDEEGTIVLDDVSFELPRGQQIALVGRSGAGKSTLVDLVPRLRDATQGTIRYDDTPIQDFELTSLRRAVGFMTQEATLFNDTILNNMTYGLDREVTDAEVRAALEKSYAANFVDELPQGLETNVGDRGVRLSGGQRQRLALARVMLEDPDILILDEPTSALDSESEEYIQRALQHLRGEKTLIVIAHRLSTVLNSDQILVLEKGRVVERGTHDDLMKGQGAYRKLFELQIYA